MRSLIKKDEVLKLLKEGWELGTSNHGRGGRRVWLQRKLMCGGKSYNIHGASFNSLVDSGTIVRLQRRKGEQFWLTRWRLKK